MRSIQNNKLQLSAQKGGWELYWHDSIDDIPQDSGEYTMLVAHEFFDALPIHVVEVRFFDLPFRSMFQLICRKLMVDGKKFWSHPLWIWFLLYCYPP